MTTDIKVAFLKAPLKDDEDVDDDSMVVLKPPSLLVKLGYAKPGEHYQAVKAVYGLRQARRKWGRHRDKKLLAMKTQRQASCFGRRPPSRTCGRFSRSL